MGRIAISVGHGLKVRGASGPKPWGLDEVDEACRVVDAVYDKLNAVGVTTVKYFDTVSTSQNENLNRITDWHNQQSRDLDASIHFNAYSVTSKPMGCEVLYVTQSTLASETSAALAEALDLPNRGGKYRGDLHFLNATDKPAVLVETCFVDSSTDAEHYNANFDACCEALAECLGGVSIETEPPEPPDVEEPPPDEVTGDNRVEITSKIEGDVTIYINDTLVKGHENCEHTVDLSISLAGDVTLVINGEEFHNTVPPPTDPEFGIQANHCDVEATVFGGASDPNYSAYPPYDSNGNGRYLNDTELYVALPYSFSTSAPLPMVRVYKGELSAVGIVADKGPWTTDDEDYVYGSARPIAETCHDEGTPLPSGPNAGKVPTNKAGIDLSPAMAETIGVNGKGLVTWTFEE